jgi:DNA (cytosine-5)-methyltransferase 1
LVENVPEFLNWGGLDVKGRPLKSKKGHTFKAWVSTLESLGYRVDWRMLCAADYGDPTTRKRLFVQAVRGKRKIVWPDPTHGPLGSDLLPRRPWVSAREIIDWSLKGESIYERKRPLAKNTLARIEAGLRKYGLKGFCDSGSVCKPFVLEIDHQSGGGGVRSADDPLSTITTKARHCAVEPFMVELKGGTEGAIERTSKPMSVPIGTVCASGNHHAVCEPMLIPQQSDGRLRPVSEPVPTVATAGAIAIVEPFLVSYYGNGEALSVDDPLDTVTTKERFGLARPVIEHDGKRYLLDIKFRMLQPHELAAAQGFPKGYQFAGNKSEMVKQIGNAVPRRLSRALCLAALGQRNDIEELLGKGGRR